MSAAPDPFDEIQQLRDEVRRLKDRLDVERESAVVEGLRHTIDVESQRYELAAAAAGIGFAELDVASEHVVTDDRFCLHGGFEPGNDIDFSEYLVRVHPEDVGQFETSIQAALEKRENYDFFYRYQIPGEEMRWIRTCGRGYQTSTGAEKVVGLTIDITDQKLAEQSRELLIREMSHRVKNLFAVISALLQSAPKEHAETEAFADAFILRIEALGETYNLARHKKHIGSAALKDLLTGVLSPHHVNQKLTIDGPQVLISIDDLTTLTLLLHEMATNAVKYGGFSTEAGGIDVSWTVDDDGICKMVWTETSPNFAAPDAEPGFGTQLIEIGALQLRATYETMFSEDGLIATLSFPLK